MDSFMTLSTRDVTKYVMQGDLRIDIIKNVTVQFDSNKTYAVRGPSGSGKSTFIQIVAGLDTPSSGGVYFNDANIACFSSRKKEIFFNKSIGMVFQWPYLIRELSVIENVMLPGIIAKKDENLCRHRAHELLKYVLLDHKAKSKPSALSGGQQQRIALVRALFNEPVFLIADEPTGSLDVKTGEALVELMLSYHKDHGMGIIVSTHDDYVARSMDIHYNVEDGKLVRT